ncbi:MAG: hypothetical protein IT379_41885 [Deltaproteobacteria bacterium]|nr:hypothetical protein [Deltaproteobacteria bacterium]
MSNVARVGLGIGIGLLLAGVAPPADARADDDGPSPWHLALDAAYGRAHTGFLGVGSFVAPSADAEVSQPPQPREREIVRVSVALGLAGLALEGGATLSLGQRAYVAWSAGFRLETSWEAPLAVVFRLAFVERTGDAAGRGGRAGLGLAVRPWLPLSLYADASAEATTTPAALRDAGTYVAYALCVTGGARVAFR